MVLRVVYQSERRHASGLQAEIAHHPFWRCERELAAGGESARSQRLLQSALQLVDVEFVAAVEAD